MVPARRSTFGELLVCALLLPALAIVTYLGITSTASQEWGRLARRWRLGWLAFSGVTSVGCKAWATVDCPSDHCLALAMVFPILSGQ